MVGYCALSMVALKALLTSRCELWWEGTVETAYLPVDLSMVRERDLWLRELAFEIEEL